MPSFSFFKGVFKSRSASYSQIKLIRLLKERPLKIWPSKNVLLDDLADLFKWFSFPEGWIFRRIPDRDKGYQVQRRLYL